MKLFLVLVLFSEVIIHLSEPCESVTESQWKLFSRANAFSNYIRLCEITANGSFVGDYFEEILKGSFKHFRSTVYVHEIDLKTEEPVFDFLELFSWSGEKLVPRNTQVNATMQIHNNTRLRALENDESYFLVFVVVKSIAILDEYLQGPPRNPFHKTRGRYVIAIQEQYSEQFDSTVAEILKRFWDDYGILRVLVVSTCQDEFFYQYHPFMHSSKIIQTDEGIISIDMWGKVQTSFLYDTKSLETWISNYPFKYNGYPMTSVMFRRLPTALRWNELPKPFVNSYFGEARLYSQEFGGVDGIILGNLIQTLNFTLYLTHSVNEYGYQLDNKSYVGTIADVLYSQAGFSSNGRFIQDYGTSEIEFMHPVFFDRFCIITPKAQRIPQWLAVFRCFNPYVWTLFILSTTALGVLWYFFKKWTRYSFRHRFLEKKSHEILSPTHEELSVSIINMWLIMTSGIPSLLPYHGVERLFMTGCLLLSLTFSGTFQGSLTTSYSTKSYYKDIHTLKELDESGLPIGTSSRNLANIFESEGNPVLESLDKKFSIQKNPAIDQAAFKRDICCIERQSDVKVIITTTFELPDGSALLHVVPECPRSYHLSFIVRKGWPYLTRFNDILLRLSESGFIFQWYNQVEEAVILSHRVKRLKDLEDTHQAFSLEDMQTAFYIAAIGLIFCALVFILEMFIGRRQRLKAIQKCRQSKSESGDKPRREFSINMH